MSLKKNYLKIIFFIAVVLVMVGITKLYAWAVQPQAGQGYGAISVDTNTNNVGFGTSTALSSAIVAIRASSSISDSFVILDTSGNTVLRASGDAFAVGGSGIDFNYSITTANGGIKAESNNSQPAAYFNNISGGTAILIGNGNVGIGKAPAFKLDVNGSANATQFCISGTNCISAWPSSGGQWTTSGTNIYNSNSGNVGVGVAAPDQKLVVAGLIKSTSNGAAYFQGGDDATLNDVNMANTMGVVGLQDATKGCVQLGNNTAVSLCGTGSSFLMGANLTIAGGSKLNVTTIDPVYDIGGEKYATYVPAMTGQKEETAGVLHISCIAGQDCSTVLDFNAVKGSDLWLFGKATDMKDKLADLSVYLTASAKGQVWYEKDFVSGKVNVFVSSIKTGEVEVSYRLTAPRFDASLWTNATDPSATGLKVE